MKKSGPIILSIVLLLILILVVYLGCVNATNGDFIYILDDVYIHLAYAKNIVLNDVWGVSRYETSSSTSSSLWTFILVTLFSVIGVNEFVPLFLNIFISIIMLIVLFSIFNRFGFTGFCNALSLVTVVVITPIAINIFTGMEHLLQTLIAILFIFNSVKILTSPEQSPDRLTKRDYFLFILSALLATVRYEGLILIFLISGILFFRKQYFRALLITAAGMIAVIISGMISINNGGYFLPNSVLMKLSLPVYSGESEGGNIMGSIITYVDMNKKLIALFILSLILFAGQIRLKKTLISEIPMLLFIILSLILMHKLSLSITFFRYDTYLIVLGIAINAVALNDLLSAKYGLRIDLTYLKQSKTALAVVIMYSVFLFYKSFDSEKVIIASKNIYEQQYQMSRFINKYYSGKEVALNDIGAVNFFGDVRSIDLIGIGNNFISNARLNDNFNTAKMSEIADSKNIKIAMLYESWFEKDGGLPSEWIKAGEWTIRDNFICGDAKVSIYAIDTNETESLNHNLKDFSNLLPATLIQSGQYLNK